MNELSPERTRQALHPAMPEKILVRAAELVELGWTRGTAARDADGQKSTSPKALAWCVVVRRQPEHGRRALSRDRSTPEEGPAPGRGHHPLAVRSLRTRDRREAGPRIQDQDRRAARPQSRGEAGSL